MEHVDDPCGQRAFAQLRAAVAAHEYDRDLRSQLPDFTRKLGPREIGHRFVAQHEVEALRFLAKRLQGGEARGKSHRLVAKLGKRLFRERNQCRLVVYDHDGLTVASRQLTRRFRRERGHLAGGGQPDREGGAGSQLGRDVNYTTEIGDDTMHQGEAKAGAVPDTFRGEERIEHALEHRGRNAAAGITHQEAHVAAGTQRAVRQ